MPKLSLSKLALCLGISTGFMLDSVLSMEVEKKSENPVELRIDSDLSMEVEIKTENKSIKRKRTDDLEFYIPSPASIALSTEDIRVLIFYYLNEMDQESALLTTRNGHRFLLNIYADKNVKLNIKKWNDLPKLSSRMNYGLNKTTATFLGLFNDLYQGKGSTIDQIQFSRLSARFRGLKNNKNTIILQEYAQILSDALLRKRPNALQAPITELLSKDIETRQKEKDKTLLLLYRFTDGNTNGYHNEKALYFFYILKLEGDKCTKKIKSYPAYKSDDFLLSTIKKLTDHSNNHGHPISGSHGYGVGGIRKPHRFRPGTQ